MVKCPICGKRVVFRKLETKPIERGMYEAVPKQLYGFNPHGQVNEPEKLKIYGCIDPNCFFEMTEADYYSEQEYEKIMSASANFPEVKESDFFISYFSGTGTTFAKYLKAHSEEIGHRTAFLDREDIPKNINENMPEWRSYIDQAIKNSDNFILIMTRRFNERPEVIREYWHAIDHKIPIFLFKQENLEPNDLCVAIGRESIDFSKFEYTEFKDECDLLTKVDERLSGKTHSIKTSWFENEAMKLVAVEGLAIKQTNEPLLEIIIGPSSSQVEWLPTNITLNRDLLSMNVYCSNYCNFNARRNYFECEPWSKEKPIEFFLRVKSNGLFHLVEPLHHDQNYWLDAIFHQILVMMFYCLKVMRFKQVNSKQSICIYLKNVHGLEVKTEAHFQRFGYLFSNNNPEPFLGEFNPMDNLTEVGTVIKKIFEDLCRELAYDIDTRSVNLRLHNLINDVSDGNWKYGEICLPAIKSEDLGF